MFHTKFNIRFRRLVLPEKNCFEKLIDLFSYVCKLPIVDHVMLSREFFLYVSENYSFIFTRICLNLKEIILKGTITWSTLGQQTNEAKEVY